MPMKLSDIPGAFSELRDAHNNDDLVAKQRISRGLVIAMTGLEREDMEHQEVRIGAFYKYVYSNSEHLGSPYIKRIARALHSRYMNGHINDRHNGSCRYIFSKLIDGNQCSCATDFGNIVFMGQARAKLAQARVLRP